MFSGIILAILGSFVILILVGNVETTFSFSTGDKAEDLNKNIDVSIKRTVKNVGQIISVNMKKGKISVKNVIQVIKDINLKNANMVNGKIVVRYVGDLNCVNHLGAKQLLRRNTKDIVYTVLCIYSLIRK